jgi:hypothetical protein
MKAIPETCRVHYYHWVNISTDVLFVLECITCHVVSVSVLTWFIKYILLLKFEVTKRCKGGEHILNQLPRSPISEGREHILSQLPRVLSPISEGGEHILNLYLREENIY